MIKEREIKYIIEEVLAPNTSTTLSIRGIEIAESYFTITFDTGIIYRERVFEFANPGLSESDLSTLQFIEEGVKQCSSPISLRHFGKDAPYLKLVYFFTNEFYFEKTLKYDSHNRISLQSVRPEYLKFLAFPVVDILCSDFLNSYFVAASLKRNLFFTCDYDILNIWNCRNTKQNLYYLFRKLPSAPVRSWRQEIMSFFFSSSHLRYNYYLNDSMFYYGKIEGYSVSNIAFWLVEFDNKKYDVQNDFTEKPVTEFISLLRSRGVKFGIHPNYDTIESNSFKTQVKTYFDIFKEQPHESRFHYLHVNCIRGLDVYDGTDIETDHSLYFTDSLVFRCGTTMKFRFWDFKNDKPSKAIYQPLTLMEGTFKDYLNCDYAEAKQIALEKVDCCLKYSCNISLLWHNRSMYEFGVENNYYPQLFSDILNHLVLRAGK